MDICKALRQSGIRDFDSQEAIDFCLERCPYDHCALDGGAYTEREEYVKRKVQKAKNLRKLGYSSQGIAESMGVSKRTVQRWLRRTSG